jgi:hypothetical protein
VLLNAVKTKKEMYLEKHNKVFEDCFDKESVYIPEKAVEYNVFGMCFELFLKLIAEKIEKKRQLG